MPKFDKVPEVNPKFNKAVGLLKVNSFRGNLVLG